MDVMNLLTPLQVTNILNCKPSSVYAWAKTGKIPAYKINGLLRFDSKEIHDWIQHCRIQPISLQRKGLKRAKTVNDSDIDLIMKRAIDSVTHSNYNPFQRETRPRTGKEGMV